MGQIQLPTKYAEVAHIVILATWYKQYGLPHSGTDFYMK